MPPQGAGDVTSPSAGSARRLRLLGMKPTPEGDARAFDAGVRGVRVSIVVVDVLDRVGFFLHCLAEFDQRLVMTHELELRRHAVAP